MDRVDDKGISTRKHLLSLKKNLHQHKGAIRSKMEKDICRLDETNDYKIPPVFTTAREALVDLRLTLPSDISIDYTHIKNYQDVRDVKLEQYEIDLIFQMDRRRLHTLWSKK